MTTQHTDYLKATRAAYAYLEHAMLYTQHGKHQLARIGMQSALEDLRQAIDLASQCTVASAAPVNCIEPSSGNADFLLQELKSIRGDIAELRKAHPFKPEIRIDSDIGKTLSEVAYIDVLGVRIPVGDGFTVGVVTPTAARALGMQREFLNAATLKGVFAKAVEYTRLVELVNGCTVRFLPGPYTVHRMGGMDFSHIVGDLNSLTDAERQFLVSRIRLAPGSVNGLDDFLRNAVKRKPALDLSAVAGTEGGAQ